MGTRDDQPREAPEEAHRARALELIASLRTGASADTVDEARGLLRQLRNLRAFELLCRLAEQLSRIDATDATTRRLYAQGLIETGAATAAVDVLKQLLARLPSEHAEWTEAWGLLGRAHKQIFFDAGQFTPSVGSRIALAAAADAYRQPYEADPRRTWHGVNLLALVSRARREGWLEIAPDLEPGALAARLESTLLALPAASRDEWYLPTLAEVVLDASLATGDLDRIENLLRDFLQAPDVQAFQVASTLRQFVEVWALDRLAPGMPGIALTAQALERARALVAVLRARLLQLPGGQVELPAGSLGTPNEQAVTAPSRGQLEAILGQDAAKTFAWWCAGVEAARSVAVVRQRLGQRLGTGFLVSAADFGIGTEQDLLFLTNHHVVNPQGAVPGIRPQDAEMIFEAVDLHQCYGVESLVWTSGVEEHDATLLRLKSLPAGVSPLRLRTELPPLPAAGDAGAPRVYIIGYPGGRELSVSLQDNELLDHEGPPSGKPQIPAVCRVHYRAPTEGGNSGSPVFDGAGWNVIALHHRGGKLGMPRLNGVDGTYAANEGLAMATLIPAVRAALGSQPETSH
ncbi:MAG TPA: serine protease [Burkholderiaceae bacterium]